MADNTNIEWTDATWNPVTGCSKASAGCKFCYAEREWPRLAANPKTPHYNGRLFTDVRTRPEVLDQPLRWKRPRRIFVNSMSDLFHPDVPFEFIAEVFGVASITTRHTYQVLTKRPARAVEFFRWLSDQNAALGLPIDGDGDWFPYVVTDTAVSARKRTKDRGYDCCGPLWPLRNVWLGVTAENQEAADERIPLLLQIPAALRFVSVEPMVGPVDFRQLRGFHNGCTPQTHDCLSGHSSDTPWGYINNHLRDPFSRGRIDWVIAGGESGPHARPAHPDWVRSLRDQCLASGVPFLFKQWGEFRPDKNGPFGSDDGRMSLVGKKAAGRLLDGREHLEFPEVRS